MKLNDLYKGLTIVEATLAESGPVCAQTFAMLGADVIHIERPASTPMGRAVGFAVRTNNKKSITLDTKSPEGKELMWKLLEKADVFLENFAPGAWERMGFSYEEVKKRNPRIVYVTIKGFAQNTRFEKCITYDPVACCSGGGTYLTGIEDGDPMLCGINVGDSGSAIAASVSLAAAVLRQKVTGKGCYVEAPMQNAVVAESRQSFAEYYARDGVVRRPGNSYRGVKPTAPWNLYPCLGHDVTGNYVVICCSPDPKSDDFEKLCKAIGREDLFADPKYATPELRYEHRHDLDYEISRWTIRHSSRYIMNLLAVDYQIPASAVVGPMQMIHCREQNDGVDILCRLELDPEKCRMKNGTPLEYTYMPTLPLKMDAGEIIPKRCDDIDSFNEEIYKGWLGISDEEFNSLKEKHVI